MTLTVTRGLPASGKSTWACAQLRDGRAGHTVRVNKDLLRVMLHDGVHAGPTEAQVVAARDAIVELNLSRGIDVIVDDTNLNPVHISELSKIAARHGAAFVVEDFTFVDRLECIRRDALRDKPVGPKVINDMHERWLSATGATASSTEPAPETQTVPSHTAPAQTVPSHVVKCGEFHEGPLTVIVDIDGTLARMVDRGPYDHDRVGEDAPIPEVIELVRTLHAAGDVIVYMSGRKEICREATRLWLGTHVGVPGELHMRASDDNRRDSIVKRELFDRHIGCTDRVRFVLDDRDQVVKMWREELGLVCLQVAPGAF